MLKRIERSVVMGRSHKIDGWIVERQISFDDGETWTAERVLTVVNDLYWSTPVKIGDLVYARGPNDFKSSWTFSARPAA